MEKEDVEFSEDPELEDPESMDDKEEDPDWHCQLEEKGECDTGADDEEKENSSMNTIRQVLIITSSCQSGYHSSFIFCSQEVKLMSLFSSTRCCIKKLTFIEIIIKF